MKETKIVRWDDRTFEVIPKEGESYTYRFLPDILMEETQIEWVKGILREAIKYKDMISVFVTGKQFLHLYHRLNFTYTGDDPTEMSFFYHLIEGRLNAFKQESGHYQLWVYPTGVPGHAQDRLIEEVIKNMSYWKAGLHLALDPNHGGTFTLEALEVAGLIIYG